MKRIFETVDCAIIFNPSNLYYFSGYQNEDALILLTKNEKYYFTDARYMEEVNNLLKDFIVINSKSDLLASAIEKIVENKYKTIGYENDITYNNFVEIKDETNAKFFEISDKINQIRSQKNENEISLIKKAQSITDKTFLDVLPYIKLGITEFELGSILESLLYQNGGNGLSFYSIVAFGENTSKPHAHRGNKKLANKQFVTMDFGASYKGYSSDMTRTIAFGNISNEEKNIYNKVKTAQQIALEGLSIGMTCKEAYNLANDFFIKEKLENYFLHSLGHGLGIDIHEKPFLSSKSDDILKENMVVSVEPGLYFCNKFGVRIEDIVVLEKNGIDNLTKSQKQLIIV